MGSTLANHWRVLDRCDMIDCKKFVIQSMNVGREEIDKLLSYTNIYNGNSYIGYVSDETLYVLFRLTTHLEGQLK
jgi:hypothetical protein